MITLKIKNGKLIKQTFSKFGHGLVILPIAPKLMAQDLIEEAIRW